MIFHVVLLTPRLETTDAEINAALEHVRALKDQIPGIITIDAGSNISRGGRGYTYGFVMQMADEQVLKRYPDHPAHQPVSQELLRLFEPIIDFDLPARGGYTSNRG